jgi:hypothetical protein
MTDFAANEPDDDLGVQGREEMNKYEMQVLLESTVDVTHELWEMVNDLNDALVQLKQQIEELKRTQQ